MYTQIDMNIIASHTTKLAGTVTIPGSKSQTIRGLVLATLAKGTSVLKNALSSDDSEAAIKVCQALGAKIGRKGNALRVVGAGLGRPLSRGGRASAAPTTTILNSGNSGITTRFILPVLGLRKNYNQPIILDCGEQMKKRPIKSLIEALRDLGMKIEGNSFPLKVSGQLIGGKTQVEGLTSQYLSALLLNLPCAQKDSEIQVKDLHERPYVEMTLAWLKEQRIKFSHSQKGAMDIYRIKGSQKYQSFSKTIPGDFSSASYFLAGSAMLGKNLTVKGLDLKDPQADKELLTILKRMGARIKITKNVIVASQSKDLTGVKINAKDIPDLLPTFAILATQAKGRTEILNVPQARIKETDRIHSMSEGLKKMGAKVKELSDGLVVYQSKLHGAKVKGYEDHRTVMSLTLAGLSASGKTEISNAESVNKTFPTFFKLLKSLGANITLK